MRSFFLFVILILASILRFWELPNNPPCLTWDEAALGYNAYSILQTGRDEYGNFLPLNLKSFGDFKPALYAYLDIPFIAIFGLNELAVRLPSAIFGVLGVLGVFLLVERLFRKRELSFLSAFFLAISPWHLQFSRPAFEANIALTLNIFAVYFFLRGLERKKILIFSTILFGLSLFTYQASRLFVPLLMVILFLVYRKSLDIKSVKVPVLILAIFFALIFWTFFNGQTSRLFVQNLFAYQRTQEVISQISSEDGMMENSTGFKILHGQWWVYTKGLFERYLIYFSPKMLFIDGDYSERHRVPDLGALYFFSVILIPIGLVYLLKNGGKNSLFIFWWLILAPLPAVFSRDLISNLRALNLSLPIAVLEGIGVWVIYKWFREIRGSWGYLGIGIILLMILSNFLIYLDRYFIHAPIEYSKYWVYGQKQIFSLIKSENLDLSKFNKVVITNTFGQPYIYYLFYTKYPPFNFQEQASLDQPTSDVGTIRKIDNIEFRHIYWPTDRGERNALFIGSLEELPDQDTFPFREFRVVGDIEFLNGEKALRIVETK